MPVRLACRWRYAAITLALCIWATPAAAQCSASANGVAFGSYNALSGLAVNSVGNVSVSCLLSLGYNISLSSGGAGSFSPRRLNNGGNTLNYNLYTGPTYLTVWGDGSGGTATVSGSIGFLLIPVNHVVYGRIPAGQNAAAGSYTDTISVTVTY
jgi:spore coat protein U-like protein